MAFQPQIAKQGSAYAPQQHPFSPNKGSADGDGSTHDSSESNQESKERKESTDETLMELKVPMNPGYQLRTPTNRSAPMMAVQHVGVPQEQYDALKQKFASYELMCLKHEEQVQEYEREIKKRENQLLEMESAYQSRLRAQENV